MTTVAASDSGVTQSSSTSSNLGPGMTGEAAGSGSDSAFASGANAASDTDAALAAQTSAAAGSSSSPSSSASTSAPAPAPAPAASSATTSAPAQGTAIGRDGATSTQRPTGNTGSGFFVVGTKLYDPSGTEFRIRGVNHDHWDQVGANVGIPLTGANTERIHIDFTQTAATNTKVLNGAFAGKIVPIVGNWTGTCYSDEAHLSAAVDTWVAQAATWTTLLNAHGFVNIANEWGPANSTVWRDAYITAIGRMRAAGYTGTLVVDSGGCGQDVSDLQKYGAAVLASDPQKNVLFDLHVYGSFSEPVSKSHQGLTDSFVALAGTGLPILIGEFGPGKNIGYSPTLVTPQQVVTAAENAGFGWMAWAYDDNNLNGCKTDDNWFGMTNYCATYTGKQSELTAFGQLMVPMLQSMAKPAAAF